MSIKLKILISGLLFFFIVILSYLFISSAHELKSGFKKEICFTHNGETLKGTLLLPDNKKSYPVVIFIHGDGPSDRFENGFYTILMNNFLENGIGVFSWDKQGVGESSGNWLKQTMAMRAEEALTGLRYIKGLKNINADNTGFIGFSQGGWVLPKIASKSSEPAFMIIVSGAVNWMDQGKFLDINYYKKKGYSHDEVNTILTYLSKKPYPNKNILYKNYVKNFKIFKESVQAPCDINVEPIDNSDKYHFAAINMNADAKEDLKNIRSPLLAIWGEGDLNVNAFESYTIYNSIFLERGHTDYKPVIFPNAAHSLLKDDPYNFLMEPWTEEALLQYFIEGRSAYTPGYLDLLSSWVIQRTE
ncbi:MAG: alpha/beta hydrolase [bacterium]|nr:alpha/beta hydrolase [bacterium]